MENLKYSLFDLFAYLMPGSILTLCLIIQIFHIDICNNPLHFLKVIGLLENPYILTGFFIILSYLLGFISSTFISVVFDFIIKRIINKNKNNIHEKENITENETNVISSNDSKSIFIPIHKNQEFVLVREHSKENFIYIERWHTLKNMTRNLSCTILLSTLFFIYKFHSCIASHTIFLWIICSLISIIVLILKSREYSDWAKYDLKSAVEMILSVKKYK